MMKQGLNTFKAQRARRYCEWLYTLARWVLDFWKSMFYIR